MKVINIIGCQCSGKTYLINELIKSIGDRAARFDIQDDFYKPMGVIGPNGRIDWEIWRGSIEKLPDILDGWFKRLQENSSSAEPVAFIESTGTNQKLKEYLAEHYPITIDFCLEIPTNDVLIERAKGKNLDPKIILESVKWFRKNTYRLPDRYSHKQITKLVKGNLEI